MTSGSSLATSNEKPLLKSILAATESDNQIVSPGKDGDRADIVHSNVSSSKDTATGPSSNTRTTRTPIPSSTGNDFGHGADGKAQYRYNDGDAATAGGLVIPSSTGNDFGHGADGKAQYRYNDGDAATAGGLVAVLRRRVSSLRNAAATILSSSVKQRKKDRAGTISSTKKRRPSGLKSSSLNLDLGLDTTALDTTALNSAGNRDSAANHMTKVIETEISNKLAAEDDVDASMTLSSSRHSTSHGLDHGCDRVGLYSV
eukprot:CAMPEP_0203661408 /NCGR_PEP_ID=MMETSP0088-20131115/59598_1 /ASSEMBLY_ACC=CAM_ASM_001087 /TAXON_ID=426623 /ORGANISM="Chaetoceros affinis, Strain CCMP159" /LENGTH=257 /DNA_ID=CAMNT_0050524083 /DNA_START=161 /DNA_END=930 /DNA_ORIENTATION=+